MCGVIKIVLKSNDKQQNILEPAHFKSSRICVDYNDN